MKKLAMILAAMLSVLPVSAQQDGVRIRSEQMSARLQPAFSFPLLSGPSLYTDVGFGANIDISIPMVRAYPLFLGGGVGYRFHQVYTDNSMSLVHVALGGGASIDLSNRIQVILGASAGGYVSFFNNPVIDPDTGDLYPHQSAAAMYWDVGAAANVFLTPAISVGLSAGLGAYAGLMYSFQAGAFVSLNFDGLASQVELREPDIPRMYPSLTRIYDRNGVGTLLVTNQGRFPIRELEVTYRMEGLMDEAATCGEVYELQPGDATEVPIVTAMGTSALDHQSDGMIASVIDVSYRLAGSQRTLQLSPAVEVLNRNALTWDDDRKAVSFIDTRDAAVLAFSREVARSVRADERPAVNRSLRAAMAMYEALGAYRISYVRDPHQPAFVDTHGNAALVDYVQYPNQTLQHRGGDCDDLTILYCSLMESIGIATALITVPGHIYPAVDLAVPPSQAERVFADPAAIIVHDNRCWLPVEITLVGSPFADAWDTGARQWTDASQTGDAQLLPVREAWQQWPNTGSPTDVAEPAPLAAESYQADYRTSLDRYLAVHLATITEPLFARLEGRPGDARVLNRLGIAFANHGLLERAEEYFAAAVENANYVPAMANLGNLYLLQNRELEAMALFETVLSGSPDHPAALAGLTQAADRAGEALRADAYLAELNRVDPEMATQLAAANVEDEDRAAEIGAAPVLFWAQEEDQ